ncbi:hypothetical protein N8612_07190, partial [Verrucomicrobia bacterium]|nr:hypothetical protein [Verrucomicrobiota bacterium]
FMFHNEGSSDEWLAGNIGEVFGVTLDAEANPNIFTTATTVYGNFPPGPGNYGGVYRLDGNSGAISFTTIAGTGNASLGSVCHDLSSNGGSWLYVSNFEDGMVYRVDSASLVVQALSYDHGVAGRLAAALPVIPDPGTPDTLSPLGRRVWGVQVFDDRLYYAVWWEDKVHPSALDANEVWSVALDPVTGEFLPTTAQLEVTLPPRAPSMNWSLPVASIDFTKSGAMLLAERYYRWDGVHQARVLEYTGVSGAWTASPVNKYRIGDGGILTAGGVVSDCDENVWATGDILHGNIYGVQRVPAGGNATDFPATANSLLIDIDEDIVHQDKTLLGAVDMFNDCGCLLVDEIQVDCPREEGAPFEISFDITNQSGQDAQWVLFTPVSGMTGMNPSQLPLSPALADGGTFSLPGIELTGGQSGETACFTVTLLTMVNGELQECCTEKVRVELPDCECVAIETKSVECVSVAADGTAVVEVCFNVTNFGTDDLHHIFVLADPGLGLVATPGYLPLSPPLAPGASQTYCIKIAGVTPGNTVKLPLTFHNRDLQECCLRELCFDVPDKNGEPQEKFCCRLPEVVYCCPNQGFAQVLIALCNKSNEPRELKWEITIPAATADCPVVLNPLTDFSSNQGSILVPPGDCREVVVKIFCERLQNVNIPCALFGVTVTDPITGEKEFCRSRVERTDDPTVKHLDPVGSDDGVPAIVDVVIGGSATIGLQVENASDERVEVELIGVGESGAIQFRQGNEKTASEWSSQLRLNAGQKRTVNVDIGVDISNPDRIAQLQKLGVTAVHFYLRFPDRRTVLAASVPVRILDRADAPSQQVRVVSVRSVQRPDGTAGVELDCRTGAGLGFQLQVCENLKLTDWKAVPFAVGSESQMHDQFTSPTEGSVKLFVPMSGGICFFRLAQDGSEIAQ